MFKNPQQIWLWILTIILIGVLFFGLRLKGPSFENGVAWLKDGPGIRFAESGLAYTDPFSNTINEVLKNDFSMELAIQPDNNADSNFGFISCIHDGADQDQLLIGQWRSYLIVMNGDDYNHKRRDPRISVDTASHKDEPIFLTITTGVQGTQIYIDGNIAKADSKLKLHLPSGGETRLTLGNSVYGKNSWEGEIHGLAIYDHAVKGDEVELHFNRWSKEKSFSFAMAYQPALLYTFEEGQGTHVLDRSGNGSHLEMPLKMRVLKKQFLSVPWHNMELNRSLYTDVAVNLLGFIPLGLVLSVVLSLYKGQFDKNVMVIGVLVCFALSLGIETAQAWIPSRSSNLHDLVLNTMGGWIGTVVGMKGLKSLKLF